MKTATVSGSDGVEAYHAGSAHRVRPAQVIQFDGGPAFEGSVSEGVEETAVGRPGHLSIAPEI